MSFVIKTQNINFTKKKKKNNMRRYLITWMTIYEEAAVIVATSQGENHAISIAESIGAKDYTVTDITIMSEGQYYTTNIC